MADTVLLVDFENVGKIDAVMFLVDIYRGS